MYEKFGFREIDGDELPKYFRRLKKVAGAFAMLAGQGEYLMVMVRDNLQGSRDAGSGGEARA